jgi:hypothetical protein
MKRFALGLLVTLPAVMVMVCWAAPALAYQPPISLIGSNQDGNTIYLRAWDPQLHQLIGDKSDPTYANTDFSYDPELYTIAWIGTKALLHSVHMATYDAYRKTVQIGTLGPYDSVSDLTVQDGVVSFISMEGSQRTFRFMTYDPGIFGGFRDGSALLGPTSLVVNQHGVVAWAKYDAGYMTWEFHGAVYDPRVTHFPLLQNGEWIKDTVLPVTFLLINSLSVNLYGTVVAASPNDVFLGYDPDTFQWYEGQTKGLSHSVSLPQVGPRWLWVWITDMSIGATLWNYDFGDGNTTDSRSAYHVYQRTGEYNLTQQVATNTGIKSSSQTITVRGRLDFLRLLLLE